MKNPIEAIGYCFNLGESTLKHLSGELSENPYDPRVVRSIEESLALLEPLIQEAEFVHKGLDLANRGKAIYDAYSPKPKFSIIEPKREKENSGLVKTILVVDDQFGKVDDPMIPERYGNGQVPGYRFELEDAVSHFENKPVPWDKSRLVKTEVYSADKVLKRVRELKPNAILLDLNFGHQRGYGVEIMKSLHEQVSEIPVLMFSSADTQSELERVQVCIDQYGAKESIGKCPSRERMKEVLDKYILGGKNERE